MLGCSCTLRTTHPEGVGGGRRSAASASKSSSHSSSRVEAAEVAMAMHSSVRRSSGHV
eukprot:EC785057.1.p5 GENE.EC785057.1~~EC785057.1.p5  ORF type:complete len:58 (-),score=5.52 EC785057.1:32-205(-)